MRSFDTFEQAYTEIARDIAKATPVTSSRVQQRDNLVIPGREILGYSYSVMGGIPQTSRDLVDFGLNQEMRFLSEMSPDQLTSYTQWLEAELLARIWEEAPTDLTEVMHPSLSTTIEGSWPGYTYRERMGYGAMVKMVVRTLLTNSDSRRAFWPIFSKDDAYRAAAPTRIPCSLGYQFVIRPSGNKQYLMLFYFQRSSDFDRFWLSDVWLANRIQHYLVYLISDGDPERFENLRVGTLFHFITSFHSFDVSSSEIY